MQNQGPEQLLDEVQDLEGKGSGVLRDGDSGARRTMTPPWRSSLGGLTSPAAAV